MAKKSKAVPAATRRPQTKPSHVPWNELENALNESAALEQLLLDEILNADKTGTISDGDVLAGLVELQTNTNKRLRYMFEMAKGIHIQETTGQNQ
jgi:hypothetical protein